MKTKANAKAKAPRRNHAPKKAAIADILGPGTSEAAHVPGRWRHFYNKLVDLRAHYRGQKRRLKSDAADSYTGPRRNEADVATNTYDQNWALSMASSDQEMIFEINEALNRIRTGTYGTCQYTGKPIPKERLEAVPWTRFTAEAERELENRGELAEAKIRLGPRERVPKEEPHEIFGEQET